MRFAVATAGVGRGLLAAVRGERSGTTSRGRGFTVGINGRRGANSDHTSKTVTNVPAKRMRVSKTSGDTPRF